MSHDIGIACRRSSEWPGLDRLGHVELLQAAAGHHSRARRFQPVRGGPHLRRLPGLDQPSDDALRGRGRGGVRAPLPGPEELTDRHSSRRPSSWSCELRKKLSEAGLDAGADTIGWHLQHHHQITLSRATINRILVRAGQVSPGPVQATQELLHPLRGRAAQRDLAVRLHPLPAHPPRRPTRRGRRDHHLARRPLPLRPCTSPPTPGSPPRSC